MSTGFTTLAVAVIVASVDRARGYEPSVRFGTMLAWEGPLRPIAQTLGGRSIAAFAGLPVGRGYFRYAPGDSLTHLGWIEVSLGEHIATARIYRWKGSV